MCEGPSDWKDILDSFYFPLHHQLRMLMAYKSSYKTGLGAKSGLLSVFVNKVLLDTANPLVYVQLLSTKMAQWNGSYRDLLAQKA